MIAEPVIVQDRVLRLAILELHQWAEAHDEGEAYSRRRAMQIRGLIAQIEKRRRLHGQKKPVAVK